MDTHEWDTVFATTISHAHQALAVGNLKDVDRRRSLFLTRAPLFAGLDHAAVEDVFARLHCRHYAAGQAICHQGEPSDSLFVLCRGSAQAVVTAATESDATTVARLRPGDVIGEVGVVTDQPRSATVIAHSDALVLELARDDFAPLLARHPRLLANLTRLIGGRLAKRNAELRGHQGDTVALVVGARFAHAAAEALEAARRASPRPFVVVDLLQKHEDGRKSGVGLPPELSAPGSIAHALERLDALSASPGTVAVAAGHDEDGIALLLEQTERVLALLAPDEAVAFAATLRRPRPCLRRGAGRVPPVRQVPGRAPVRGESHSAGCGVARAAPVTDQTGTGPRGGRR
jgi:CRP-like cAMP-binding protein